MNTAEDPDIRVFRNMRLENDIFGLLCIKILGILFIPNQPIIINIHPIPIKLVLPVTFFLRLLLLLNLFILGPIISEQHLTGNSV